MKNYEFGGGMAVVHRIPYNPLNDEETKKFFGDHIIPKLNINTDYYENPNYVAEFWNNLSARWEGIMPGHYIVNINGYYVRVTREVLREALGIDEVDLL